MKKLILILFVTLFSSWLMQAQGNLQFNQGLALTFVSGGTSYTVPTGKIWKIESVGLTDFSSFFRMTINGKQIVLRNSHTSYGPQYESLPYWVPGGLLVNFSGYSDGVVSIIEFNIIP
jgi:hypothetical protein